MQQPAALNLNESRPPTPRLLSIKELCEVYGGTTWYWRTQIWSGKLAYVQVEKKMLVDTKDVEAFIARHKKKVEL